MNNQEVFDRVARHLLTQKVKSKQACSGSYQDVVCAYRGQNGTSCAVGCLIPDEMYDTVMEGKSVSAILPYSNGLQELFRNVSLDLLGSLQTVHDNTHPEQWTTQLLRVADCYVLDSSVLKEFLP